MQQTAVMLQIHKKSKQTCTLGKWMQRRMPEMQAHDEPKDLPEFAYMMTELELAVPALYPNYGTPDDNVYRKYRNPASSHQIDADRYVAMRQPSASYVQSWM